ncbi:amino acid racemase [Candidatus Woesebacteria bacterium]|nr:amino acid racemase [Candidatus Woesebacteria bacterium]
MKNKKRPIGIIGGMGPFASAELLNMVLMVARDKFGARNDEDFPDIVLTSIPVETFFKDEKNFKSVLEKLQKKIQVLEQSGVSSFGIACNTAHILSDDIKKLTKMELVSIIDQTVKALDEIGANKIGLLASPVTIRSQLYQDELEKKGVEVILPDDVQIRILGKVISDLVAKRNIAKNRKLLLKIAESLVEKGAQAIILGCTELPLAFPKSFQIPVVNTIEVLADSLVKKYYE